MIELQMWLALKLWLWRTPHARFPPYPHLQVLPTYQSPPSLPAYIPASWSSPRHLTCLSCVHRVKFLVGEKERNKDLLHHLIGDGEMATIASLQTWVPSHASAPASMGKKKPFGAANVPVSAILSRLDASVSAESSWGRSVFGRGLENQKGKPSHGTWTVIAAAQQSTEAVLNTAKYPTNYQQLVSEVKARLEKERGDLPAGKNGRDDEETLLWFLRDRKFDVDATVAKLVKALEWRKEFGVEDITEASISRVASSGEACLHTSWDARGRPVIIVSAAKHFPNDEQLLDSKKLCVYLIEKSLSQLPPGGETFLGIFDLRGFQQKNGDLKFVKFLIDVFFNYYPKRLGQVLFVDAPFIFQPGWNMVKPLVGKYAALVRFCSADEVRNEYFTPDTVPESFRQ